MPVESATYVNQLVSTNPPSTDPTGQGDDHLRLIKAALVASFPAISGAVNATDGQLNALAAMLNAKQSMVPTGAMMAFANTFSDANWLRCNGGTFNYVDHPELGAFLGYGSGVCTLPNLEDTGRFLRAKSGSTNVRDTQSNQNKSHTHTGSGSGGISGVASGTTDSGGSHSHTATSNVNDPGHGHDLIKNGSQASSQTIGVPAGQCPASGGNPQCVSATLSVASNTTGITVDTTVNSGGSHTHTATLGLSGTASISFTTNADGGSEARPEAYVVVYYIHV